MQRHCFSLLCFAPFATVKRQTILCISRFLFCCVVLLHYSQALTAQTYTMGREEWITWEQFLENYAAELSEEASESRITESEQEAFMEMLEELHAHPINLNTASREALLSLPFLTKEQADSILSYRNRKRLFFSFGELLFIKNLSYTTRQWLSLFTFAGDTLKQIIPLSRRLVAGKHEIVTRIDLPLYQRAGYRTPTYEDFKKAPNSFYQGEPWANTLRYRYSYGQDISYGITLQKDAGEPFFNKANAPYDYYSAYFHFQTPHRHHAFWFGDFNVCWAEGLLINQSFFTGKLQIVENTLRGKAEYRHHSSAEEYNFFRGFAARWHLGKRTTLSAFASYRQLDATISENSVTSIQTSGQHRTINELNRLRTLNNYTGGFRWSYLTNKWELGAHTYYSYYDKPLSAPANYYNQHKMRGHQAAGAAASYAYSHRQVEVRGEIATDTEGHFATSNTLKISLPSETAITLQQRSISSKFISPFGRTLQAGSTLQNEHGALIGINLSPFSRTTVSAYADYAHHPQPIYRSRQASNRWEVYLKTIYASAQDFIYQLRYHFKSKQQNPTGFPNLLEYVTTHRGRFSLSKKHDKVQWQGALDIVAATSQTLQTSWGYMISARTTWKPLSMLTTSLFASAFFTDDYSSRIYASEPQLQYSASFPTFYKKGIRMALLANWKATHKFTFSLRYALLHYFNLKKIGTGANLINSPTKNDLSIQLKIAL